MISKFALSNGSNVYRYDSDSFANDDANEMAVMVGRYKLTHPVDP
jgi:hypothetical protein